MVAEGGQPGLNAALGKCRPALSRRALNSIARGLATRCRVHQDLGVETGAHAANCRARPGRPAQPPDRPGFTCTDMPRRPRRVPFRHRSARRSRVNCCSLRTFAREGVLIRYPPCSRVCSGHQAPLPSIRRNQVVPGEGSPRRDHPQDVCQDFLHGDESSAASVT